VDRRRRSEYNGSQVWILVSFFPKDDNISDRDFWLEKQAISWLIFRNHFTNNISTPKKRKDSRGQKLLKKNILLGPESVKFKKYIC
jgi:hypothetical protein